MEDGAERGGVRARANLHPDEIKVESPPKLPLRKPGRDVVVCEVVGVLNIHPTTNPATHVILVMPEGLT